MQEQDMKSLLEAEEESMQEVREHDVVKATVVAVDDGQAYVNIAGLKADIPISKRELASPEPDSAKDVVKVDDEIEVFVVSLGGENGATVSKVRADRMVAWKEIEALKEEGKTVIVVHHDLQTVPEYFDEVVLINRKVIASGKVSEVFTKENIDETYKKSMDM